MQKKVLINCSNLHVGGAVAVASSFIFEVCEGEKIDPYISFIVSSKVHTNLIALGAKIERIKEYVIYDSYQLSGLWKGLDKKLSGFDVVFTVFGPAYFLRSKGKHIFGFAQPWIIYPSNPVSINTRLDKRLIRKIKFKIQSYFYSRADQIVVELEHVKKGLLRQKKFTNKKIHIVYSCVDTIYSDRERWRPIDFGFPKVGINLGIIARNYPHKNLQVLPIVKEILLTKHNINANICVTLSDDDWLSTSEVFRNEIINVGSLSLAQCPTFYENMDGVIFPSLLECFSAAPFEAMFMKKPLFASDLPFIVDCCKEFANYFDPLNVEDIAGSIATYFCDSESKDKTSALISAKKHVECFSSPFGRAKAYLKIISDLVESL